MSVKEIIVVTEKDAEASDDDGRVVHVNHDTTLTMPLLPRPSMRWKVRFPEPTEEVNPGEEGVVLRAADDPVVVQAHLDDEPLGEDGKGIVIPRGGIAVFEPQAVSQWTKTWPTEPGWYWFCNAARQTPTVEVARMRRCGRDGADRMYSRSSEFLYEEEWPEAWWHPMEKPPEPIHAFAEE